jgi:hypothetical protein
VVAVAAPPPPPPPPPAKAAEPDHPLLTLLGTVAGEGESMGVFVSDADKSHVRLRTGEGFDGWILRAVRARDATFEKTNRTATLALPARPGGETTVAVAPRVVAPAPPPASASAEPSAGTWKDGDGQMIAPPRALGTAAVPGAGGAPAPLGEAWMDGDGQVIASPPGRPPATPGAAPSRTAPLTAAATWQDGDGQLIAPPGARTLSH